MHIDSCILFYLLEKKFSLKYIHECQGKVIHSPRLLDKDTLEADYIYLTDSPEKLRGIKHAAPCSILLIGPAEGYEIPVSVQDADIACIEEQLPVIQAFQYLYTLFLDLLNWDMRLNNASLEGVEYTKLFTGIREFYNMPLILHDRNFFTIAYTNDFYTFFRDTGDNREQIPLELCDRFELREPFIYPPYPCSERWLCGNIFNGSHFEGRLVTMYDQTSANIKGQLGLLAHYCTYVSRVFINNLKELIEKKQEDPLHELIRQYIPESKDIMEKDISAILKEAGWQINDGYSVVLFQIPDKTEYKTRSSYMCRHLEAAILKSSAVLGNSLLGNSFVIWIINDQFQKNPGNKCGDFLKLIPAIVQEFNGKAGISNKAKTFMELRNGYIQADAALRLGGKKDAHLRCYQFSDYALDYIMEKAVGDLAVDDLLHRGILALAQHDRQNGTEYVKTINYFINARYNMTTAAENLPVHRITFLRRIEKIKEISRIGFDDPDEMLHVRLSIKLLNLV